MDVSEKHYDGETSELLSDTATAMRADRCTTESAVAPRVRVLSVCHIASGDAWAGAEAQVATLLRGLRHRRELSVAAIVLNQGRLAEELRAAGVDVKVIQESKFGFVETVKLAAEFVQARGVQILHSHRYKENLLALLIAQRCRIPVQVRTVHGMREPFHGWNGIRQAVMHTVDHWSGRFTADAVIAVSDGMAPRLTSMYGARKVATIRNGIEASRVYSRYEREEARARLHCSGVPVVGIVGRLVPVKRIDLFVRMAEQMILQAPNARFLIAGDGPERVERMEQVRQAGLARNVRFLGHRDDIYDVLRALDVLVMCSDHEGMPMTLLEAQWIGVPVVGRAVAGIREVLRDGYNGLCVAGDDPRSLAEACLRLLREPELGPELCRAAAQEIECNYLAERNAEAVAELYHRLVEGARR